MTDRKNKCALCTHQKVCKFVEEFEKTEKAADEWKTTPCIVVEIACKEFQLLEPTNRTPKVLGGMC